MGEGDNDRLDPAWLEGRPMMMMTGITLLMASSAQIPPIDYMTNPERAKISFDNSIKLGKAYNDKRTPTLAVVRRMEGILGRFRCIGAMSRWRRTYTFTFGSRYAADRYHAYQVQFHACRAGRESGWSTYNDARPPYG